MPTYEYICTKCRYAFEKFQSMNDKPLSRCPKCRSKVRRLIGKGSGIIFKGSGFYETDYKKKRGGGGEEKPAKPASTPKVETSSGDSKSKVASTKKD